MTYGKLIIIAVTVLAYALIRVGGAMIEAELTRETELLRLQVIREMKGNPSLEITPPEGAFQRQNFEHERIRGL